MIWFRVDNRLVHGQIIEAWLPYLEARELVVVNDDLADDAIRQQIMQLAIPGRVKVRFVPLGGIKDIYDALVANDIPALVLLVSCQDARRMVSHGVTMNILNVANIHYSPGRKQICPHVAASEDDIKCLHFFKEMHVDLDFRCIPADTPVLENW